ncbi:MAG: hypothetical protein IPJ81_00460 [Chitinophagaceae bacterium]|jgi:hypothetical protein|nr:hypothetical protein [Chitinophagaceae bacterium]
MLPTILFRVLGFMNGFYGGYSIEKHIVQQFFEEDQALSNLFVFAAKQTLAEFGKIDDIEVVINKSKVFVIISKNLCQIIDNINTTKEKFLIHDMFSISIDLFPILNSMPGYDSPEIMESRLEFLSAALVRSKKANAFMFYNDFKKATLVHHLLRELADDDDEISWYTTFSIPTCDKVSFNETGQLFKMLTQKSSEINSA